MSSFKFCINWQFFSRHPNWTLVRQILNRSLRQTLSSAERLRYIQLKPETRQLVKIWHLTQVAVLRRNWLFVRQVKDRKRNFVKASQRSRTSKATLCNFRWWRQHIITGTVGFVLIVNHSKQHVWATFVCQWLCYPLNTLTGGSSWKPAGHKLWSRLFTAIVSISSRRLFAPKHETHLTLNAVICPRVLQGYANSRDDSTVTTLSISSFGRCGHVVIEPQRPAKWENQGKKLKSPPFCLTFQLCVRL